jgi:hypothetical protein
MSWPTRDDLAASARTTTGLLSVSPDAGTVVPAAAAASFEAALRAVGVGPADRVVVALSNDGEGAGSGWARAAAEVASAAASAGPRGRLRLHRVVETVGANTLVITPTGAMDLLARLHLEFLLDPLDLGLRTIVLTGEIASKRTMAHLASEFECDVAEVYTDPFSGAPVAWRAAESDPLTPLAGGALGLAAVGKDVLLEAPYPAGLAELVLSAAAPAGAAATVRTGQVVRVAAGDGIPAPSHTVGDHLLIRGLWLSLPRIEQAMSRIDGVAHWTRRRCT